MAKKVLKFTCPKCGKNKLASISELNKYYVDIHIKSDGSFECVEDTLNEKDFKIVSFECLHCGFQLKDEKGHIICDCEKAAQWVIKHCKQDWKL